MNKVRIDPIGLLIRCYKEDIDPTLPLYLEKTPYYKVVPIILEDDGTARFTGAIAPPTFQEFTEIKDRLRELGCRRMTWRHKDKQESFEI